MHHFSPETQQALKASGWHEDRHVDTSDYERALLAAGSTAGQAACQFLQRYGDLEVVGNEDHFSYTYCLNTCQSVILKSFVVSYFSPRVGRTLYCIGKCYFDFMYLLMDDAGRVYRHDEMTSHNFGGIDLSLIAASGEEAIEKLILEAQTGVSIEGEWIAHHD